MLLSVRFNAMASILLDVERYQVSRRPPPKFSKMSIGEVAIGMAIGELLECGLCWTQAVGKRNGRRNRLSSLLLALNVADFWRSTRVTLAIRSEAQGRLSA